MAQTIFDVIELSGNLPLDKETNRQQGVGSAIPALAIVATLIALAVIATGFYLYYNASTEENHRRIVIATGPESGTYHVMGQALKRVLEHTGQFESVELRTTDGSVDNMALIGVENGPVDLAFVQGDVAPNANARLITSLYNEVLHILITTSNAQNIENIYDLEGARVSLGGAGSGTRELAQRVLNHFGVKLGQDFVLPPQETADALAQETIDAAFLLTAVPSPLISGLAMRDQIRFISLGEAHDMGDEAHALELVFPGVQRDTIPRSTYVRLPRRAVHTVRVAAMLVARADLEEDLVREITTTVFDYRSAAAGWEGDTLGVTSQIRENYDPSTVIIPFHPGAAAYYRREEPSFVVQYAEALSFALTLMLGLYSLFIAFRQWLRRRMKNRVDFYLLEVERVATNFDALSTGELIARRNALVELRRTAFADLIAERLFADDTFIILQNHLRDELAAIEGCIAQSIAGK
jgi:TRAP transporter TAXI family solute receptor